MVTEEQMLFQGFPDRDHQSFLAMGKERYFEVDEQVIQEDTLGSSFYIILDGVVSIWRKHSKLGTLYKGDIVGELVIFRSRPRSATVRAETVAKMLAFEREDIIAFFKWRDERLFKIFVINVIHILAHKLARTSESIIHLENQLRSKGEGVSPWVRSSIS